MSLNYRIAPSDDWEVVKLSPFIESQTTVSSASTRTTTYISELQCSQDDPNQYQTSNILVSNYQDDKGMLDLFLVRVLHALR